MTQAALFALCTFAFVTSITPGPNNLLLLSSGATFGVRRTVPHVLGVGVGFALMILLVGVGLARLFEAWPPLHLVLKVAGVLYLLWLAWKIATSPAPAADAEARRRPLTFLQGMLFQWVNPKGLSMAVGAVALFAPAGDLRSLMAVSAVFSVINLNSMAVWVLAGQALRVWLSSTTRLRLFNFGMAALLVASIALMI